MLETYIDSFVLNGGMVGIFLLVMVITTLLYKRMDYVVAVEWSIGILWLAGAFLTIVLYGTEPLREYIFFGLFILIWPLILTGNWFYWFTYGEYNVAARFSLYGVLVGSIVLSVLIWNFPLDPIVYNGVYPPSFGYVTLMTMLGAISIFVAIGIYYSGNFEELP